MQISDLKNIDLVLLYTHNKGSNNAINELIIERLPTFKNSLLITALEAVCYSKNHVVKTYSMLKKKQNIELLDLMKISEYSNLESESPHNSVEQLKTKKTENNYNLHVNESFELLSLSNKLDITDYQTLTIYGATLHIQLTSFEEFQKTAEFNEIEVYQICLCCKIEEITTRAFTIFENQRLYSYETLVDLMQNAYSTTIKKKSKLIYYNNLEYYSFIEQQLGYTLITKHELIKT